jgi:translation initiation factor IF-3
LPPQAHKTPVCKLIDYGKFLYELQQKEKHQRKTATTTANEELRFKWRHRLPMILISKCAMPKFY